MNCKACASILSLVCLALGFLMSCSSSTPPLVLNVNNAGSLQKLWSYATGNVVYSLPAVVNGMVYVGSADDNVYALNASTGAKLWSYATGNVVYSSPAVVNSVVYIGSWDFNVYAFGLQ